VDINYKILVVDDILDNIQVVMNVLGEFNYELSFATSGEMALELVQENDFDMVLLDIMMPTMDGFDTCKNIKKIPNYADVPIIFLTAKVDIDAITKAYELGGVDYITKPFRKSELLARVATHLELYKIKKVLQQNNITLLVKEKKEKKRMETELEINQQEFIFLLTEMMEATSLDGEKRSRRVAKATKFLASHCEFIKQEDVDIIYHATPTYDIGKTLLQPDLLLKNTRLTEDELKIMQTHPIKAHEFLGKSPRKFMKAADIMAYQHHERWDGSGYPRGLQGEEIHIFGRLIALVDVFDALLHKRVYRNAWSSEDAVDYIVKNRGILFDPVLVDIFKENSDEFLAIVKS